jgi:hypothetical protein
MWLTPQFVLQAILPLHTIQHIVEAVQLHPGSPIANVHYINIIISTSTGNPIELTHGLSQLEHGLSPNDPLIIGIRSNDMARNLSRLRSSSQSSIYQFHTNPTCR